MDDKESSLPKVGSARRRLIRGAFGMPVVLTVSSGSVAAASNMNCILRTGTFPPVFEGTAPPDNDTIIRIQVHKIGSLWCVRGQDVPPVLYSSMLVAPSFMSNMQVWEFNRLNNQTVGVPISPPSGNPKAKPYWAALRFDANGYLMGVGLPASGASGYAVSASCWTSFGA